MDIDKILKIINKLSELKIEINRRVFDDFINKNQLEQEFLVKKYKKSMKWYK